MKADHQTYARASSTALLGLALQIVMGLGLVIYAIIAKDRSAFSGSLLVLMGSAVWLVLAVLFDQHRRERIEALEAEQLSDAAAGSGRSASVFGEAASELRVAAKRLSWMHSVLVPTLSLIWALALGGLGAWRFVAERKMVSQDPGDEHLGWALGVGLAVALIGFLFARYVAGMAKVGAWANLRGGAGQAVAAALVGGAMVIGHLADYLGFDLILRYLHVVFPVAMMLLSAEVILNFLLGVYRPRTAGETPRPAMDSRVLSFVAAPDKVAESIGGALNYQFGFNVTDSWFYQLVSRWLASLVAVGVVVVWLMTSLAVVQPNEQGVILRFGRIVSEEALRPGLYVKFPWPIDVVEKVDATTIRPLQLANETPKVERSILWTNDHGVTETYFPVQPSDRSTTGASRDASAVNDLELVSVEVPLYYVVEDYAKFRNLTTPESRDQFLRSIGRRELLSVLSSETTDRVLGVGRQEISARLAGRINERLASLNGGDGAGVRVVFVSLVGAHPPRDTAEMFESVVQRVRTSATDVEQARADAEAELIKVAGSRERARSIVQLIDRIDSTRTTGAVDGPGSAEIDSLERQASELIAGASGEAADLLIKAQADRWVTHMGERTRAQRHGSQLAAYRSSPMVYKSRKYFETLREVMAQARVYVVVDDGERLEMRLNLEDSNLGSQLFDAPRQLGQDK
ncbi:MAG: hypothetical protein KF768_04420 [Phycisphaeraceae bacterium]|nr:hypothetical protein [Phycisphaeraceae bacterium]